MCDINFPDNSKTSDSIIMKFSVLFLHVRCHYFKESQKICGMIYPCDKIVT